MAFFVSPAATVNATSTPQAVKDVQVSQPPTDSISSLAFSDQASYLAVGSWDNNVRVYQVGANMQSQGKSMYQHNSAVLSVCWSRDGSKVFSGGADNTGRMFDATTGQGSQVAQHAAPVKVVKWIDTPHTGLLVTGSWDKTIKYWDLRSATPAATVELPERCYSLDAQYPYVVVGTADRHIQVFNLNNPTVAIQTMLSPLRLQTRVVSWFRGPTKPGFAIGGVEGRLAMQFIEGKDQVNNYTFRCHRKDTTATSKDQAIVFPVNDISFHPIQGIFSTCGSDGAIHFWDKDARARIKSFEPSPGPITATAFNSNGTIFAYAVSYDWHKGYSGMIPDAPNKVMLHACTEEEVRRKGRKT